MGNKISFIDKFLEKAQCIIWQYGNYTAKSVNKTLNGVNTQVICQDELTNQTMSHTGREYC